jgi:hypothetical protein
VKALPITKVTKEVTKVTKEVTRLTKTGTLGMHYPAALSFPS